MIVLISNLGFQSISEHYKKPCAFENKSEAISHFSYTHANTRKIMPKPVQTQPQFLKNVSVINSSPSPKQSVSVHESTKPKIVYFQENSLKFAPQQSVPEKSPKIITNLPKTISVINRSGQLPSSLHDLRISAYCGHNDVLNSFDRMQFILQNVLFQ